METLELYNPTRFVVPVRVKDGTEIRQINLQPRTSMTIVKDQITDTIANLTDPRRRMLVIREKN